MASWRHLVMRFLMHSGLLCERLRRRESGNGKALSE